MKELTCAVCKKPADYILHNKYGQPLNICESCYKYLWGPMPIGKWIFLKANEEQTDGYECSVCKAAYHTKVPYFSEFNFCPNCGARMVKK